jgi:MscS family membrane protein
VASVVIIGSAAQELGLPLYSVVAGLGIGGLAVALANRPTLENLIGGIVLYLDQSVRVGDFCSFGDQTGTVETIGVRSTKIRALDRTLITIADF